MATSTMARQPASTSTEIVLRERRRFTVKEYYRLAKARVLRPDERVELLEGEIVQMSPIGSKHAAVVDALNSLFMAGISKRAIVRIQGPVQLGPQSLPEPDVALLSPRPGGYFRANPGPGDVLLLVEVSDTTLHFDRDVKLPIYAWAGIPEVWIVDVQRSRIHVYRDPDDGVFGQLRTFEHDGSPAPAAFPDLVVPVAQLFEPEEPQQP